jgi:hypothetical protein
MSIYAEWLLSVAVGWIVGLSVVTWKMGRDVRDLRRQIEGKER